MSDQGPDDLYVGYQKRAPASVTRFLRPRIVALMLLAPLIGGLLVVSQGRFAAAWFEFGNDRQFEGIVSETPYPALLVARPGDTPSF